jgi:hypothetical protein
VRRFSDFTTTTKLSVYGSDNWSAAWLSFNKCWFASAYQNILPWIYRNKTILNLHQL